MGGRGHIASGVGDRAEKVGIWFPTLLEKSSPPLLESLQGQGAEGGHMRGVHGVNALSIRG